jgi:phage-related protein
MLPGSTGRSNSKKSKRGILIVHAFVKKTQKTPPREITLARKRLEEMLDEEQ